MIKTIIDIAKEHESPLFTNEHVFQWVSEVLADESVSVRSEFDNALDSDGSYRVVIVARPKV